MLVQMREKRHVHYVEGADSFLLAGEPGSEKISPPLVPPSDKMRERLERVRDLLYRYGSTGCQDVIRRVISRKKLLPIYPVSNLTKFSPFDEYA